MYNFLYATNISYIPPELISGGLGLGITKKSFAMTMKTRLANEHSIYLSNDPNAYSHILFGGKDNTYYSGNVLAKLIVSNLAEWSFDITEFIVQNPFIKVNLNSKMILDPNFPLIGVPENDLDHIIDELVKNGLECNYLDSNSGIQCPCSNISSIGDISVTISDEVVKLPLSYLYTTGPEFCYIKLICTSSSNLNCAYINQQYSNYWIMGSVFHIYYYTFYAYSSSGDSGSLSLYTAIPGVQRPMPTSETVTDNHMSKGAMDVIFQIVLSVGAFFALLGIVYGIKALWKKWLNRKRPIYDSRWEEKQQSEQTSEKDSEKQSIDDDEPADIELRNNEDEDDDGL